MPTAQQLLAEKQRIEGLLNSDRDLLAFLKRAQAEAQARGAPASQLRSREIRINDLERSIPRQEANLIQVNRQIAASNTPTASNPPNPQVPTAPAAAPAPAPTTTTASNPPNPQVPPANNNVPVVQPQTTGVYTGDPTQTDPGFVPYSARPQETPYQTDPGEIPGITVSDRTQTDPGFVDPAYGEFNTALIDTQANLPQEQDTGFSPYGEENDPFDPTLLGPDPALFTEEYVQEQDNPVDGIDYNTDTGISPYGEEDDPPNLVEAAAPAPADNFTAYYDSETGQWNVRDDNTGNDVYTGLSEQQAILKEQDLNAGSTGYYYGTEEAAQAADLGGDLYSTQQLATLQQARAQQILRDQQKQVNQGDWRVKLRLAPGANYLYDDPNDPGILAPLSTSAGTGGVVFPYTPQIITSYNAKYDSYDLTHSNYRGYFYQGSHVGDIQVNATFTAQDSVEAAYLLAVIHFFRSVTKMFYGKDPQRGAPPPLVFLEGMGQFQFNRHPCVVSQFNYNLPADVDYIRANSPNISSTNLLFRRTRQDLPTNAFSSAWTRLKNSGLFPGATYGGQSGVNVPTFGKNSPTYVPTKIEISLVLLPMQTRQQVSQDFSLKEFSNGKLIQKGFW